MILGAIFDSPADGVLGVDDIGTVCVDSYAVFGWDDVTHPTYVNAYPHAYTHIPQLVEAIVLPMTHKEAFENIGIQPPKGTTRNRKSISISSH